MTSRPVSRLDLGGRGQSVAAFVVHGDSPGGLSRRRRRRRRVMHVRQPIISRAASVHDTVVRTGRPTDHSRPSNIRRPSTTRVHATSALFVSRNLSVSMSLARCRSLVLFVCLSLCSLLPLAVNRS